MPMDSVLTQDLSLGEGEDALADGDAAELRYSGWVLQSGQATQVRSFSRL